MSIPVYVNGRTLARVKDHTLPKLVGHLRLVYAECLALAQECRSNILDTPIAYVVRVESETHIAYVSDTQVDVVSKRLNFHLRYKQREFSLCFNGKFKPVLDTRQDGLVTECLSLIEKPTSTRIQYLKQRKCLVHCADVDCLSDNDRVDETLFATIPDISALTSDGTTLRAYCKAALKISPQLSWAISREWHTQKPTKPAECFMTFAKRHGEMYRPVNAVEPDHIAAFTISKFEKAPRLFVGKVGDQYDVFEPILLDVSKEKSPSVAKAVDGIVWIKKPDDEGHTPERFKVATTFPLESWQQFNSALALLQNALCSKLTGAGIKTGHSLFDVLKNYDSRLVFISKTLEKSTISLPMELVNNKSDSSRFLSSCKVVRSEDHMDDYYNAAVGAHDIIVTSEASLRDLPFVVYLPKFFTIVNKLKWEQ